MSENVPPLLDPKKIADRDFSSAFRGFDPTEVRSYLRDLSNAVRILEDRLAEASKPQPVVAAEPDDRDARLEELEGRVAKLRAERDALAARVDDAPAKGETERLTKELEQVRGELTSLKETPAPPGELDEAAVTRLLGEETTRVLDSARSAAAEISARAQAQADVRTAELDAFQAKTNAELTEQRKAADEYAATVRSDADGYVAELRATVEEEVATLRSEAATETEQLRAEVAEESATQRREAAEAAASLTEDSERQAEATKTAAQEVATAVKTRAEEVAREIRLAAEADAEKITGDAGSLKADAQAEAARIRAEAQADASTSADAAREEARQMVAEAQAVREKILEDLVKRRRNGRQQLDQVKAARDRMARSLVTMQVHLDAAVTELDISIPEARKAMEAVAKQVGTAGETASRAGDVEAGRQALAAVVNRSLPTAAPSPEVSEVDPHVDGEAEAAEPLDEGNPEALVVEDVLIEIGEEGEPPDELDSLFARIREESGTEPDATEPDVAEPDAAVALDTTSSAPDGTADVPSEPVDNNAATLLGTPLAGDDVDRGESDDDPEPEIDPGPHFTARDVAFTRNGAGLRRKLKRALADDQSDILDRLQQARGKFTIDALAGDAEQADRYAKAAAGGLEAIAAAGAKHAGGRGRAPKAVHDVVDDLVQALVPPLRTKTEASIIAADGDVEEALEAVRTHYREARGSDLPDLLDDAMAAAFAVGLYSALPDGAALEWITDPRVMASPDCFDNTLADDVAKPGEFPTGHRHPLGSPGCRCLVVARG